MELKKANGDVFFEATRPADNSCIHLNWIGIQSIETIMMGANLALQMLRQQPCDILINNTTEQIGPWEDGAVFLGSQWAPKAAVSGLKQFRHILAPGIFGRRSFQKFEQLATKHLQVEAFETEKEAKQELQC